MQRTQRTQRVQEIKNTMSAKNNLILPFSDDLDLNDEKDKELHSQFHSLFTETVPSKKMPIEDDEGIIPDVYQEYPAYKIFRFYIGDFSEEGVGLNVIMNKLSKAEENDILEFHIDSNGGSINEGKRFYNLINNFHAENVIAMLNTGYSMGALLFCMTPIRIVHEFSDLMFHDYSTMVYGKAGEIETNHVHASAHVRNFFKKIILDKKFMTKEEFELMLVGKEFWMDTEEMCKRGIATHVKTQEGTLKAEDYLEKIEKERNPVKEIKEIKKVQKPVKKEPVKKEPVKKPSSPKK